MGTAVQVSRSNENTPAGLLVRKEPETAGNKQTFAHSRRPRSGRILKAMVLEAARSLFASGDRREYSSVIAKRLSLSEATVDRILVAHALAGERFRHAAEIGVRNAVAMAQEASASVWEDMEVE